MSSLISTNYLGFDDKNNPMHDNLNKTLKRDTGKIDLEFEDQAVSTAKDSTMQFGFQKNNMTSTAAEQIYGDKKVRESRNLPQS